MNEYLKKHTEKYGPNKELLDFEIWFKKGSIKMFIMPGWIKNKKNEKQIREILNSLTTSLVAEGINDNDYENSIKKLNELGETIIIEKLEEGYFGKEWRNNRSFN